MPRTVYAPPRLDSPLGLTIMNAAKVAGKMGPYDGISPAFNICLYLRGRGTHACDGGRAIPYAPGSVAVSVPGKRYARRPHPGEAIEACWVNFEGPMARDLFARLDEPGPHVFDTSGNPEFRRSFTALFHALKRGMPEDILLAHSVLLTLILEALRRKKEASRVRAHDPVGEFIRFCAGHLAEPELPLPDFLLNRRAAYESFRKKFRKATGLAPREYWLRAKLAHAKQLLAGTLPVEEIASRTGFETPAYFSRIFKKKEGMTPTEFRRHET